MLRVFPALGKTGALLLLLIAALLVIEVFAPQLLEFELVIPDVLFYGLLAVLVAAVLLLAVLMRKRIRHLLQYHGAEHMAINTYRQRQPLTAENIAQADRATPSCGSVLALIFVIIAVPLMFVPYGDYFLDSGVWRRVRTLRACTPGEMAERAAALRYGCAAQNFDASARCGSG